MNCSRILEFAVKMVFWGGLAVDIDKVCTENIQ